MSKEKAKLPIIVRDAQIEDVNFIFSSWLKSFRGGLLCKNVDNTIYFAEHHKLIEKLLKRSTLKIACDANDVASIVGWTCYEKIDGIMVIHYAYTKHYFRGLGIQREIMKHMNHDISTAGIYTHDTLQGARLSIKYNLIYHPYILLNYNDGKETKNLAAVDKKEDKDITELLQETKVNHKKAKVELSFDDKKE